MTYTVTWLPDAEAELAELWMSASDRERVQIAADQTDQQLRLRPNDVGESHPKGRRILISPPLTVIYRVRDDDRLVQVLHVQSFPPRN
jgi:hypothetical protein